MVRSSGCGEKKSQKRGPWTAEEDDKLVAFIQHHGHGSWRYLPSKAGLERCGKSCRLRWTNYLRPGIKRGNFSLQEEQTIIQLHAFLGNRWSAIAAHLPKRTDNEIKNYWNTRLKKRLTKMGIDPITHKPKHLSQSKEIANISHMVQWESARVQAEARLGRGSKFISNPQFPNATAPPPWQPPCLDILKVWEWTNPASNMLSIPTVGLSSSSVLGNPSSKYDNQMNEGRGMIELDHLAMDHSDTDYVGQDCLGFRSFIDGFAGTGHSNNAAEGCWGVLEDIN